MAKVRITTSDKTPWMTAGVRQTEQSMALLADGAPASAYRILAPGGPDELQMAELRFHPGEEVELHCHDESEILYVLQGSMKFGSKTLGPGACISIDGGVFYGFTAGPDGLRFLNFRARSDHSFHLPDRRQFIDTGAAA